MRSQGPGGTMTDEEHIMYTRLQIGKIINLLGNLAKTVDKQQDIIQMQGARIAALEEEEAELRDLRREVATLKARLFALEA